jgi:hypothetical protein
MKIGASSKYSLNFCASSVADEITSLISSRNLRLDHVTAISVVYARCMCIHSTTLTACVSTVLPLLHVYPQYYPYLQMSLTSPKRTSVCRVRSCASSIIMQL